MSAQPERVLITGGTGFFGCHLAARLLSEGVAVRLLDLLPLTEPSLFGRVEALRGDVRRQADVQAALAGVDAVVHAAMALPLASRGDILTTGIDGTRVVLEAARAAGIERVVHISSTAVYGIPDHHPLVETDRLQGVGAYGQAKVSAEEVVGEARGRGQVVPILRPKTFIGTGRLGVFQILFDWIQQGCRIPVIGDGSNRYQLLAVEDLCQAAWLCLTATASQANDTFNVGAERYQTVREDLEELFGAVQSPSRVLATPARACKATLAVLEAVNLSPIYRWIYGTADADSFVSTERLQQQLGWRATASNAQALIAAYRWYESAWPTYQHATGTTHRVAWKQGALSLARWALRPSPSERRSSRSCTRRRGSGDADQSSTN